MHVTKETFMPYAKNEGPQRSEPGEARTQGPSVLSQALYH